MWLILIFILLLAIVLEAITTIPLVLIVLLYLAVVFERPWIFALAFFTGLFLDLYLVRNLGQTSLLFVVFLFIILLYERKFEIKTVPFVFVASFLGAIFYLLIFGNNYFFVQALISSVVSVLLFKLLYC